MADVGDFASPKNSIKSYSKFENEIKTRLKWNKSNWELSGERGTRINKLINSMHYWKTKLKPALEDISIVFTVFNEERDIKTDVGLIIETIEALDITIKVKGYSTFRNPRYLCIYFDNKNDRDKIVNSFKMVENGFVVYLDWACNNRNNVDVLKVHWLPMTFSLELIKKELSKYVNFIEHEREELKLMSGREVPSGKVTFKISLKEGITAESVPHTAIIGHMEALITMPSRLPMCLNCSALGHISKNCKLRYCQKCKQMKTKEHKCENIITNLSYAAIVKNTTSIDNYSEHEDWEAAFEERKEETSHHTEPDLLKKIEELNNKIQSSKTETDEILKLRNEKKRKANEASSDLFQDTADNQGIQSDCSEEQFEFEEGGFNDSDVDTMSREQAEKPMAIDLVKANYRNQPTLSRRAKNKAKEKNRKKVSSQTKEFSESSCKEGAKSLEVIRTYGKPNYNNTRRLNEEKVFNKACQKSPEYREFVFKD